MDQILARQLEAADERWLAQWLRGPTQTRWDKLPVQVDDLAPDIELVDANAHHRWLSEFWKEAPLHLFFMRHYGCSCMKERWRQLGEEIPKLRARGAESLAIGMGEPERTRLFIQVREIPVPVLCDPEGKAYSAYGIIEGTVPSILHADEWHPGDGETGRRLMGRRRDTDLRLVDNPWILPAEFIIDQKGIIRYAHRYQYCEDYPPTTVLVGAIRSAK